MERMECKFVPAVREDCGLEVVRGLCRETSGVATSSGAVLLIGIIFLIYSLLLLQRTRNTLIFWFSDAIGMWNEFCSFSAFSLCLFPQILLCSWCQLCRVENGKAFGQIQDDQRKFRNIIRGLLDSLKGTLWIKFNHWSNDYCKFLEIKEF